MIQPTVGRVVWIRNRLGPEVGDQQPEGAMIAYVHGGRAINVGGFDHNGSPFALTSLRLRQPEDLPPPDGSPYAEWMPFQQGQTVAASGMAKDIEDLKGQIAALDTRTSSLVPVGHGG